MLDISLVMQVFVLINPLSSLPVLVAAHTNKMDVKSIAFQALLIAFALAFVMIFIGPSLFGVFHIGIDAFRIAGGVVLFMLGLSTARGERKQYEADKTNALTSLIATPLLTGPAVISFVTIYTYEFGTLPMVINVAAAFIVVGAVFTVLTRLIPRLDMNLVGIVSRVLGLCLLAVAIQMLATGVKALLF